MADNTENPSPAELVKAGEDIIKENKEVNKRPRGRPRKTEPEIKINSETVEKAGEKPLSEKSSVKADSKKEPKKNNKEKGEKAGSNGIITGLCIIGGLFGAILVIKFLLAQRAEKKIVQKINPDEMSLPVSEGV